MSEIEDLQGRLAMALDRIERGSGSWNPQAHARVLEQAEQQTAEVARLEAELGELQGLLARMQAEDAARAERAAAAAEAAELAALDGAGDLDDDLNAESGEAVAEDDLGDADGAAQTEWPEDAAAGDIAAEAVDTTDDMHATGEVADLDGTGVAKDAFDIDVAADEAEGTDTEADTRGASDDLIALADETIAGLEAELRDLRAAVAERDEEDARLKEMLSASVAEVQSLRKAAANDAADIAEASDASGALKDALQTAETEIARKDAELEGLRAELESERTARTDAEEALREKTAGSDSDTADLREQIAAQRESLATLDAELGRIRSLSTTLRDNSEALRTANAQGLGEAGLINAALEAEYAALKAERAGDLAEIRAVMDALTPLLAQGSGGTDTSHEENET